MTLPHVGASLPKVATILPLGRKTWKDAPTCMGCGDPAFPRGRDLPTGLCWWCVFPRSGGMRI